MFGSVQRLLRSHSEQDFEMFLSTSTHIFLAGLLRAALAFSPSFQYGTEKVRGVSLGGWLVLEVRIHDHFSCICKH